MIEYAKYTGVRHMTPGIFMVCLAMSGVSHQLAIVHKKMDLILEKLRGCIIWDSEIK